MSQKTVVQSELDGTDALSKGVLAYVCNRTRGEFFDLVHKRLKEAESAGMTRKELASRINKSPTRLSHILAAPGNWTIDTVAELLIGISKEMVDPNTKPMIGATVRNMDENALVEKQLGFDAKSTLASPSSWKLETNYGQAASL